MTIKRMGAVRAAAITMTVPVMTAVASATAVSAAPLVSQGIGAASCERLAADIDPARGLNSPVNLALLAWVQGYVSAANIALLEGGGRHVDMTALDDNKVLTLVQAFCRSNPGKKPVAVIDDLIRHSEKVKTTWEPGTVQWDDQPGP